jgi:hypothetical protein
MEAQMDYDYHAFKNNPGLEAFVRPPFPCELPEEIVQRYADLGLELDRVMVSRTKSPHVRVRKFFFRPIRRTGGGAMLSARQQKAGPPGGADRLSSFP